MSATGEFRLDVLTKVGTRTEIKSFNYEKFSSAMMARDSWMKSTLVVSVRLWQCVDDWAKPNGERHAPERASRPDNRGIQSWKT